jgi:hypothetical protein
MCEPSLSGRQRVGVAAAFGLATLLPVSLDPERDGLTFEADLFMPLRSRQ